MATIFYERDANPSALKGKTIAVFGYGNVESGRGQHSLKRGSERDIVFDDKNWHEVSLRPYL